MIIISTFLFYKFIWTFLNIWNFMNFCDENLLNSKCHVAYVNLWQRSISNSFVCVAGKSCNLLFNSFPSNSWKKFRAINALDLNVPTPSHPSPASFSIDKRSDGFWIYEVRRKVLVSTTPRCKLCRKYFYSFLYLDSNHLFFLCSFPQHRSHSILSSNYEIFSLSLLAVLQIHPQLFTPCLNIHSRWSLNYLSSIATTR